MSSIGMISFTTSYEKSKGLLQPSLSVLTEIRTEIAALRKAQEMTIGTASVPDPENRKDSSDSNGGIHTLSKTMRSPPQFGDTGSYDTSTSESGTVSERGGEGKATSIDRESFAGPESTADILAVKARSMFELLPLRMQRQLRSGCKRKDPADATFSQNSSFSPYRALVAKEQSVLSKKLPFFSDYGQDKWIYTHIYGGTPSGVPHDGVFIDVGAREPEVISNSNFWDYYFCWTGLAIEANDHVYPLQRKFRPWSSVKVAIDETARDVTYLRIEGKGHGLSGIYENMTPQHRQRIKTDVKPAQVQKFPLTTTTLATLIRDAGITHVDLLLIDVEGSEYAALASIDWNAVTIDVINFEDNCGRRCFELLEDMGYRMVAKFRQELIFLRKGFMPSLPAISNR
jgi:hypothetical protein